MKMHAKAINLSLPRLGFLMLSLSSPLSVMASSLELTDSYKSSMNTSMSSEKTTVDDSYDDATDAMDLAYEAISTAITSLSAAYAAAGESVEIADLAWTGVYGCKYYTINDDGDKEYSYSDYSVDYADGVDPADKKTLTVSTYDVAALSTEAGWSESAECGLKTITFDNY